VDILDLQESFLSPRASRPTIALLSIIRQINFTTKPFFYNANHIFSWANHLVSEDEKSTPVKRQRRYARFEKNNRLKVNLFERVLVICVFKWPKCRLKLYHILMSQNSPKNFDPEKATLRLMFLLKTMYFPCPLYSPLYPLKQEKILIPL